MSCSWVPAAAIPEAARPDPMMAMPIPASPQNSSSMATGMVRPVLSPSIPLAKNSHEYRPISAACSTMGNGNSSRSSHSSAAGRITSSANW